MYNLWLSLGLSFSSDKCRQLRGRLATIYTEHPMMPHFVPTLNVSEIKFFASHRQHVTAAQAPGVTIYPQTLSETHWTFVLSYVLCVISTEAGTRRAPEPGRFSILHNQPGIETLDKC